MTSHFHNGLQDQEPTDTATTNESAPPMPVTPSQDMKRDSPNQAHMVDGDTTEVPANTGCRVSTLHLHHLRLLTPPGRSDDVTDRRELNLPRGAPRVPNVLMTRKRKYAMAEEGNVPHTSEPPCKRSRLQLPSSASSRLGGPGPPGCASSGSSADSARGSKEVKHGKVSDGQSEESGSTTTDLRPTASTSAAEEVKVQTREDIPTPAKKRNVKRQPVSVEPSPRTTFDQQHAMPPLSPEVAVENGEIISKRRKKSKPDVVVDRRLPHRTVSSDVDRPPDNCSLSQEVESLHTEEDMHSSTNQLQDARRDSPKLAQVVDGDTTEVCATNPTPNTSDQRVEGEESSFSAGGRSLPAEDAEVCNHEGKDIEELSSPCNQQPSSYADSSDQVEMLTASPPFYQAGSPNLSTAEAEAMDVDECSSAPNVHHSLDVVAPDFTHSSGMVEACDGLSKLSLSDDMDLDSDDDNILREAAP